MRWVLLVAALIALAGPSRASDILAIQGAAPAFVTIEPGQSNVRVALHGRHLDQVSGGQAFRKGRLINDLNVALGTKSPAVRDVFIAAGATAAPGDYNIAVLLGNRTIYLPVLVRVIQPRLESGRRVPDAAATEAARRNLDAAERASVIGR
jgi:hypothetical protein